MLRRGDPRVAQDRHTLKDNTGHMFHPWSGNSDPVSQVARQKKKIPYQPHKGKCTRTLSWAFGVKKGAQAHFSGGALEENPANLSAPKYSFPILPRVSTGPGQGAMAPPAPENNSGASVCFVAPTDGGRRFCLEGQPSSQLCPANRAEEAH